MAADYVCQIVWAWVCD